MKLPLISFILLGCNQEKFVREAVDAAFSQTYSPLEIILTDDCSDDDTFTIMQSMADRYHGRHKLILNRNQTRRVVGGHINRAMDLSHGELIVIAAADDISLPDRTRVLYEAWEQTQRQATSLHSGFIQINESGEVIQEVIKNTNSGEPGTAVHQNVDLTQFIRGEGPVIFGCTHAWSRALFNIFGDLREDLTHEDTGLAFRSILLNGLYYVNEQLVKYRLHGSNLYLREQNERIPNIEMVKESEEWRSRAFRNSEILYCNMIMDIKTAILKNITSIPLEDALIEAERRRRIYAHKKTFHKMTIFQKLGTLLQFCRYGQKREDYKQFVPRLVPFKLFIKLRWALHRLKGENSFAHRLIRTFSRV